MEAKLRVERASKIYAGKSGPVQALDDISLEVPEHGSLAVLGRNGVGKSTLLLSIMGCTVVSRGRMTWRGADITRLAPHRRACAGLGASACIVSGGAAPYIAPALKVAHRVVDNIVLVGLHAAAAA